MKNDCLEQEQVFALAHRMLSGKEEEEARVHVGRCENCRKAFEGYQTLDSVLDEWKPAAEPSPWFDARLRAAIGSAGSASDSRGFFGLALNRWLALPALALLLVIVGVVTLRNSRWHPAGAVKTAAAVTAVSTAPPAPNSAVPASQAATQELKMYQNLRVLEDYDMLADFDVISELPKGSAKVED